MRIVRKVGGMSAVFYAANRPLSDGVDIAYNIVDLGRGGRRWLAFRKAVAREDPQRR